MPEHDESLVAATHERQGVGDDQAGAGRRADLDSYATYRALHPPDGRWIRQGVRVVRRRSSAPILNEAPGEAHLALVGTRCTATGASRRPVHSCCDAQTGPSCVQVPRSWRVSAAPRADHPVPADPRGDGTSVDRDTVRVQPIARIRVLGRFDLSLGGVLVPPLESARAESLLAFLVLHRHAAASRQHLAFLLWPDSTEAQARTNLRHVLHTLRRRLPDADRYLEVTSRTVGWRADAAVLARRLPRSRNCSTRDAGDERGSRWRCVRPSRCTPGTCWRGATTSGCSASGNGCGSGSWTRSQKLAAAVRGARRRGRRDRARRAAAARRPVARGRPTGS